jgi:hypothetical protein
VQQSVQSIPDNTITALTFGASSEDIDTHGFHDTASNTSRITPTVAGYYRFYGVYYCGTISVPVTIDASFRKNGATTIASGGKSPEAGTAAKSVTASCIQSMNGSTDYMEFMALQDSAGATNTNVSARFTSIFECEFIRPL